MTIYAFEVKRKSIKPKIKLGLFLCLFTIVVLNVTGQMSCLAETSAASMKVLEELSPSEKKEMINSFLKEGDELVDVKEYDQANAAYERVFILDSNNMEASKRIDHLKKQMLAEGKSETELVTHVYDAEIEARVHYYWIRAKTLVEQKKWGEARLTLEKILLLSPMHSEAQKLYKEVKSKASSGEK